MNQLQTAALALALKNNSKGAKGKRVYLTIVIKGESAENLLAVGPKDIRDYFLPKGLSIDANDVQSVRFVSGVKSPNGRAKIVGVHKDNF